MIDPTPTTRRAIVWTLRAAVLLLVAFGVSGTVRNALVQLSAHEWQLRPTWLVASGALYVAGLLPMAWFWHRALAALGHPAPWQAALRAYFLGHLGKYVPGKAMAVILRVAAVQRWVPSVRIAIACSLLETLTMMSVGAVLAAALSLAVLQLPASITAVAAAMAIAVGLPTLPPVARWLASLGVNRWKRPPDADGSAFTEAPEGPTAGLEGVNLSLLAKGWLAASSCWLLLGLSLWATLRAMGIDQFDPLGDLPRMIATVALAVVAGFASMLPGGLGVRDLLLTELLAPTCGATNALLAAVLMRLVWLLSELAVCVILYVAAKFR